jgi:predicted ester cyclase
MSAIMTVDQMVAEGDLVAVRFSGRGTNTGSGNGLPATGNYAEGSGITIFRMMDEQIADEWSVTDELGLLRQLGLLPAPGQ